MTLTCTEQNRIAHQVKKPMQFILFFNTKSALPTFYAVYLNQNFNSFQHGTLQRALLV